MTELLKSLARSARISSFIQDLAWAVLAPLLAIMLRNDFNLTPEEVDGTIVYVLSSFVAAATIFPLFAMRLDIWEFTSFSDLIRVTLAVTVSVVLTTFIVFVINRHVGVARSIPAIHYFLLLFPLLASRVLARSYHGRRPLEDCGTPGSSYVETRPPMHILLVGVNRLTELYSSAASEIGDGEVEILGIVSDDADSHGRRLRSHSVLGRIRHLRHFLQEFSVRGISVDKIVVCVQPEDLSFASQKILQQLEQENLVSVEYINELLGIVRRPERATSVQEVHELSSIQTSEAPATELVQASSYFTGKRVFDLMVIVPFAIVCSPFLAFVAVVNKFAIGEPILFWQKRPGRNGRTFKVFKFRTMLTPYDEDGNRIPDELRQTRYTRFVRRTRVDELPQLYNILLGHMSLIGPRPLLPKDQPKGYAARLTVAPGVTGWAQVNGGEALSAEEKLALDVWYVVHASLWLDIKILMRTLLVVVKGDQRNSEIVFEALAEFRSRYPRLVQAASAEIPQPRLANVTGVPL